MGGKEKQEVEVFEPTIFHLQSGVITPYHLIENGVDIES